MSNTNNANAAGRHKQQHQTQPANHTAPAGQAADLIGVPPIMRYALALFVAISLVWMIWDWTSAKDAAAALRIRSAPTSDNVLISLLPETLRTRLHWANREIQLASVHDAYISIRHLGMVLATLFSWWLAGILLNAFRPLQLHLRAGRMRAAETRMRRRQEVSPPSGATKDDAVTCTGNALRAFQQFLTENGDAATGSASLERVRDEVSRLFLLSIGDERAERTRIHEVRQQMADLLAQLEKSGLSDDAAACMLRHLSRDPVQ